MRTTKYFKNGFHITVTEMNEPSEEAIYEFRKAITQIIREYENGLLDHKDDEENEQSEEGR